MDDINLPGSDHQTTLFLGVGQCGAQILQSLQTEQTHLHSLLVDAESKVLKNLSKSHRSTLDKRSIIFTESGCGNQFFHGRDTLSSSTSLSGFAGRTVLEATTDAMRYELERFDNFNGLCLVSALGGGTGSGFGSKMLEYLADNFQTAAKMSMTVLPNEVDIGAMGAYNSILALSAHLKHVDLTALSLSLHENTDIVKTYGPLVTRSSLFHVQRELAPLPDMKVITGAYVETSKSIPDIKLVGKQLRRKYQAKWHPEVAESSIPVEFHGYYWRYDSKRDTFPDLTPNTLVSDAYLNCKTRRGCLYRNSRAFLQHLVPLINSVKRKLGKGAYLHHFTLENVDEIKLAVERLEDMFHAYTSTPPV